LGILSLIPRGCGVSSNASFEVLVYVPIREDVGVGDPLPPPFEIGEIGNLVSRFKSILQFSQGKISFLLQFLG
jgi:hypothetical protein